MSYPAPTPRLRRSHITAEERYELEARSSVHAGILPTNTAHHVETDAGDPPYGAPNFGADYDVYAGVSPESGMRGWTAQQPYTHVDVPVMHLCVMCALVVDPDHLREHRCPVLAELEH